MHFQFRTKLAALALGTTAISASALVTTTGSASADIIHADDVIVNFSMCIGSDCNNGESFGFDTLRLKENNLRINFADTSSSASFPTADWRIVANDTSNGGASYLAFEDSDAGRQTFKVFQGAPRDALVVASNGNVGFGTGTPVVELHIVDGDSPTIRLEQNGSSGFTPQTWDVAGNETNFFVRDATNGSKLPFKIRPNAPTDSLYVNPTGNIGIGFSAPTASLHVRRTGATPATFMIESATADASFILKQVGATAKEWEFRNQAGSGRLNVGVVGGNTPLKIDDLANNNLIRMGLDGSPDLVSITGRIEVGGVQMNVPDYVFEEGYALKPLSEVATFIAQNGHLPGVPSATEINGKGSLDLVSMQFTLLEKIEELTLYALAQEDTAAQLSSYNAQLSSRLEALEAKLQ